MNEAVLSRVRLCLDPNRARSIAVIEVSINEMKLLSPNLRIFTKTTTRDGLDKDFDENTLVYYEVLVMMSICHIQFSYSRS